jgi:hypothetical protein
MPPRLTRLTPRAEKYLTTLRRHPAVPVERVAEALRRAGCAPNPIWLDFHERYAGYQEPLGNESAIFGIVHADSYWIPPGEACVEEENGRYSVMCAEVHGSFDYRLEDDGAFSSCGGGGPCASFDGKIEQNAVFVETRTDGRRWVRSFDFTRVPAGGLEPLRVALGAERVDEASDRFASVWRGRDVLWLEGVGAGGALCLWMVDSVVGRVRAVLIG